MCAYLLNRFAAAQKPGGLDFKEFTDKGLKPYFCMSLAKFVSICLYLSIFVYNCLYVSGFFVSIYLLKVLFLIRYMLFDVIDSGSLGLGLRGLGV